jgi:hypothetical protein
VALRVEEAEAAQLVWAQHHVALVELHLRSEVHAGLRCPLGHGEDAVEVWARQAEAMVEHLEGADELSAMERAVLDGWLQAQVAGCVTGLPCESRSS